MPPMPQWQCLDPGTVSGVEVRRFKGHNWEAEVASSGITEFSKNLSASRPSGQPTSPARRDPNPNPNPSPNSNPNPNPEPSGARCAQVGEAISSPCRVRR